MMLDERKASVLRAVVEAYISTAQPVGSSSVVRANGGSDLEAALLAGGVAAVFCLSFLALASHPDTVTIGYKG